MSQMIGSLQEVLSTQTNLPDSATRKISSWSDNFFGEIIKMTCMYFMDNGKVFDTPVYVLALKPIVNNINFIILLIY